MYGAEGTWWRIDEPHRAEAIDDATRLAICDQHGAGLSILTDGEQRRQTFSGHFYSIEGIDSEEPGEVTNFGNDVGEFLTMKARPAPAPVAAEDAPPPPEVHPAPGRRTAALDRPDPRRRRRVPARHTPTG